MNALKFYSGAIPLVGVIAGIVMVVKGLVARPDNPGLIIAGVIVSVICIVALVVMAINGWFGYGKKEND